MLWTGVITAEFAVRFARAMGDIALFATRCFYRILVVAWLALVPLVSSLPRAIYAQADPENELYLPILAGEDPSATVLAADPLDEIDPNCPPPAGSSGVSRGDFNGDGFADLAIGVPREDLSPSAGVTVIDAGAVNIIYGGEDGLSAEGDQFWHQNSPGVEGEIEPYDYFGSSLAAGNFNGDNYSDLAIGVAGEDVGNVNNAGAVNILYGSANGLTATNNQIWNQGSGPSGTLADSAEANDRFGSSLAWGNFNSDRYGDLAIGIIYEDVVGDNGNIENTGAVAVLFGTSNGLTTSGNQFWHQDVAGIIGRNETNDQFGYALTGGNFNGDDFSDLAIGIPDEDLTPSGGTARRDAGAVLVIYGSGNGLTASAGPGNQIWSQGSANIQDVIEAEDHFGMALASGDFDNDNRSDLAVGVPHEDVGDIRNAGAVNIFYGTANGLTATGNEYFNQESSGTDGSVDDSAETDDLFGSALTTGDFNGDGFRDLAVGVPYEDNRVYIGAFYTDFINAGAVNILVGYAGGLTTESNNFLFALDFHHQDAPCFMNFQNHFGQSLTAWNFGKGSRTDLAVGSPGESNGSGCVGVFYGPLNLDSPDNQTWTQDSPGIEDSEEPGDEFGRQLY